MRGAHFAVLYVDSAVILCFRNNPSSLFYVCINFVTETVVGTHDNAIRAIEYSSEVNGILTGSWDATAKLWDPRSPRCVGTYTQPDKVLVMCYMQLI